MPTVHAKDLQPIIADILEAAGGLREYAEIVAAHLVSANLSGTIRTASCARPITLITSIRAG